MPDKSLTQLSEESKLKFGAGEHHEAAKLLTQARRDFPQAKDERIDQGPDGTLCVTTIHTDENGGQKIVKQVPVDNSSAEYRAEDYRDTSEDGKSAAEVDKEEAEEAQNDYGKVNTGESVDGPATELRTAKPPVMSDSDLESFTKSELHETLESYEVDVPVGANKAELIAAYKESAGG